MQYKPADLPMRMDFKAISQQLKSEIQSIFKSFESGISEREDSKAFGGMIESKIKADWKRIVKKLKWEFVEIPGRRTIFDFAAKKDGMLLGFDVKTKDLDSKKYSDGEVCAIGNLLKFLANDNGIFFIIEFGHTESFGKNRLRDLDYIEVAPFHLLPENTFRIENLGTGQVRLNYTINQVYDEIKWNRSMKQFYDIFTDLAITHYRRVSRDVVKRIKSIEAFRKNGYKQFKFIR
jgi:hypothetical protein